MPWLWSDQTANDYPPANRRNLLPRLRRTHHETSGGTTMLAKEKWQINTIAVLERVFDERVRQIAKHGEAMRALPDGTGPTERWVPGLETTARDLQIDFRREYEQATDENRLTRMHLVREELAEAFELDGDDPAFVDEILQVAALCVQWAEYKLEKSR